jgi:hypothetical protein
MRVPGEVGRNGDAKGGDASRPRPGPVGARAAGVRAYFCAMTQTFTSGFTSAWSFTGTR